MDIALAIDHLFPAADYVGSVASNSQDSYARIEWRDSRSPKPTWEELETAWTIVENRSLICKRINEIKDELVKLDNDAFRPLCTVLARSGDIDVSGEIQILAHLEDTKETLRNELAGLLKGLPS